MPSKKKVTYGPTVKERAKRLLEALLDYVNWELEDVGGISLNHKWKDETTDKPKLVIKTELRTLEFLTAKDKHEGKLTTTEIRQALNQHLKDFLEILEDHRLETQGDDEWHFTLTLWSKKDKQKNLEQFEIKWESLRPEKSKKQEETLRETVAGKTPKPKEETINWQEICRHNLAQQKQLTTNPFTNANGMTPQLDGVYVPLAIVERQKPKPQPRNQQEEKEKETEKLIPIAEERFFEDVLRQGKSDISQGRKIAIIGEPGAGKTTRLQKIADWILEQDLGLPIWIDLAELGDRDICQYLEKVWLSRCQGEVTRRDLEGQINRVWLLLDGVDEMAHTQGMQQLAKDLLRSWVQAARVVVTCRVNVWEADKNAFSGFDVFRNLEFNPEQVTEYIRRWFAGMGDAATGETLEFALAESENSRLKELIQNPLRLWMLCQIWSSRQGTLPDTQAKLYGSFIKYIYRWKEQFIKSYAKLCDKTQSECQKLLHEGLGELAKVAIDGKSSRFRLSYQLVSQYLGARSDETSLLSLALSLGWLNRVGIDFDEPEESVYAFYHATFQEYFAALAVDDWDYFLPRNHVDFPVVGKEYRIFEASWKQVILLWLGLEDVNRKQKEEFIEALLDFKGGCNDFYEYQAYFLAAAGIAEFKDCSQADAIVAKIIDWGFGYFSIEKQKWQTFLDPIAKGAIGTLLQTNYSIDVNQLIDLLTTTEDENIPKVVYILGKIATSNPEAIAALIQLLSATNDCGLTRWRVAESLGKIAIGNSEAIASLIGIISTTTDTYIRYEVSKILDKIAVDNSEAIAALIEILSATTNVSIRSIVANILGKIAIGNSEAIATLSAILLGTNDEKKLFCIAYILGKIDKGNPDVVAALINNLSKTNDEYTRRMFAHIFSLIGTENPEVIAALIGILSATNDENTRRIVAYSLAINGTGNPRAIAALIELLSANYASCHDHVIMVWREITTEKSEVIAALIEILSATNDKDTRWTVADSLVKIDPGNPKVIAALIKLLSTTNDENIYQIVADSLGKIDPGNPKAIAALIGILSATNDEDTRWRVAESLGKIDPGNPEAIAALIKLLSTTNDENIHQRVADSLGKIDPGNPKAIAALIKLLSKTNDEYTCRIVAESLGKIDPGNPEAIATLIEILSATNDDHTRGNVTQSLNKIVQNDQMPSVVSALQQFHCDQTHETNSDLYKNCFEIIWNCAQNIPYATFYQAWHHQLTTPHPEVPETTGVGSTPFTQSLNLADLPNILDARLVETQLIESLQLICIDTSKFIDSHNPALEIYGQFLDQNCPQRPNGEPETLPQLKSYWNQLHRHSDKHPILIFYEDPTSPAAQGLSPTFLEALTRFDGTLCLITDTPHPPLQTFSPHDPDLLQTVVNWLKRVHLES
ncbi:signal transduction protein [Tychonema bourrellyi FEM_GT703]|uniref:Signal transduction protein n=2 Tax=Tychonema bourrellyi TaxID=54313 RepID=A0A2G4EZF2_9CYAN|nr:signal transduction protein [Tychonema bourrellyi FEM_GT703]